MAFDLIAPFHYNDVADRETAVGDITVHAGALTERKPSSVPCPFCLGPTTVAIVVGRVHRIAIDLGVDDPRDKARFVAEGTRLPIGAGVYRCLACDVRLVSLPEQDA